LWIKDQPLPGFDVEFVVVGRPICIRGPFGVALPEITDAGPEIP
jgi:hypothetical protein